MFHSWPLNFSSSCCLRNYTTYHPALKGLIISNEPDLKVGKNLGRAFFIPLKPEVFWRFCCFWVAKDSCRLFVMHFSKWAREQTPFWITTWYYQPSDFWCLFLTSMGQCFTLQGIHAVKRCVPCWPFRYTHEPQLLALISCDVVGWLKKIDFLRCAVRWLAVWMPFCRQKRTGLEGLEGFRLQFDLSQLIYIYWFVKATCQLPGFIAGNRRMILEILSNFSQGIDTAYLEDH